MLAELIALDVFQVLLVFTRVGAAIMTMPGFGGTVVPRQARLAIAMGISLLVVPLVGAGLPAMPNNVPDLFLLLIQEVAVGAFLGMMAQAMMSALNLAGTFIAMQSSLANVFVQDPITQQQGNLLPSFFANIALVLIFITNIHHLMLQAVFASYELFRVGAVLPVGDMANALTDTVAKSFALGMQLAGPVIVFAIIFNVGLGVVSRLMPQMQVFFVALPLQVMGGLALVMITLPLLMAWFLHFFENGLITLGGGS